MHSKQKGGSQFGQQISKKKQCDIALSSNSENSEDEVEDLPVYKKEIHKQRQSVSAESYGTFNKKADFKAKVIPKTEEQKARIQARMNAGFMFNSLNEKEVAIVIDAMEEKIFSKGEYVIKQGEEGNVLFIVDSGELDCYKNYGKGDQYLKTYIPGESFGELALLFQSPRAASIKVQTDKSVLWQLDRETFNMIVKEATIKKREKYEKFLMEWSLLAELDDDPYEKLKISDALYESVYKKGQVIANKGTKLEQFFILENGLIGVYKDKCILFCQQELVRRLDKQGDYFGEISIAQQAPEPFTYIAEADTRLFFIPKKSYSTTLKIIQNTIFKNIQKYYQGFI